MKKAFYILFAFYFISLSVIPCGDKDDCNEVQHSQLASDTGHHQHEDEACTPFCVCSCCATHILLTNIENNFAVASEVSTIYTPSADSKITSAIIPIWQPPKLV